MQMQIESQNVEMRPEWRAEIESRLADLQAGRGDIVHSRVRLTKHRHHKKADDADEALIVIQIPNHTVTAKKSAQSCEQAIREAFDAIDAELETIREKRASHDLRLPPVPRQGVIGRIFRDDGYGFILDGGEEIYFHRHAVHGVEFDTLEDGMEVTFNVEQGEKGPQATTVNPLPPAVDQYANKR